MNLTEDEVHQLLELKYGCYFKLSDFNYTEWVDIYNNSATQVEYLLADEKSANSNLIALIISIVFAMLNVSTNSLLIFSLYKTSKTKMSSGQKLFVYLSWTDLISGFVVVPL